MAPFSEMIEGGNHPLLISSTVIVPIIHVKNKAGVCSSILKIKMKNENCHKTEVGSKENSTFGLSDEYQQRGCFLALLQEHQGLVRDSFKAALFLNLLIVQSSCQLRLRQSFCEVPNAFDLKALG